MIGYKRQKNIFASIAQIILAVWLLPFLCGMMSKLLPSGGPHFFNLLIQQIPIADTWLGIVTDFSNNISVPLSGTYLTAMIWSSVEETLIIGMWLETCKKLGDLLDLQGIPVLQTVSGIVLGCLMSASMGSNMLYNIASGIFLLVLNAVLIIFTTSRGIILTCVLGILELTLECCIASFSVCYVATLLLMLHGLSASIAVPMLVVTLIPMLFGLTFDHFFLSN